MNWFFARLPQIAKLGQSAQKLQASHTHGVVYAVQLSKKNLLGVKTHAGGIWLCDAIKPEQFVAKAHIPMQLDSTVQSQGYKVAESAARMRKITDRRHFLTP